MSKVTLTDLELEAIWNNIRETRTTCSRQALQDTPSAAIVDGLMPVIEKIIERRLTAQRQWVGGRDA